MWTVQQDDWISHVDFDFDFWFFCFTFILNLPKCSGAKSFFSSNSTRSCHFLLQCKFNFNLVGAKNIRSRVFSPASVENIYLQKWIEKLQQMLPSIISILSSFAECKASSTSRIKIVLTNYGELLLKKFNIRVENSGYLSNFAIRFQKFHCWSNMVNLFNLEVPFLSEK